MEDSTVNEGDSENWLDVNSCEEHYHNIQYLIGKDDIHCYLMFWKSFIVRILETLRLWSVCIKLYSVWNRVGKSMEVRDVKEIDHESTAIVRAVEAVDAVALFLAETALQESTMMK
jgi:hypothetical protein